MRSVGRQQLIIIAVAGLALFLQLGAATLWDIDEPRNATCAREMLERDDRIVPTFNGELRAHKPVLLYWLMMIAYQVFGVSEFSARCGSALCSIGTALVTYHLGRKLFSDRVGLWAGLILATSINFVIVGRAATPDAVLLFCVTSTLAMFALGARPRSETSTVTASTPWNWPSWKSWAAVYGAMGCAVLAKGPVGVVLPMTVIGLTRLVQLGSMATDVNESAFASRWTRLLEWTQRVFNPRAIILAAWNCRPLLGALIVGTVALPWYVAVAVQTNGAFLEEFLIKHNVSRFLEPMEHHQGPIVYYLLVICVGFFPWSLLFAPTWQAWRNRNGSGRGVDAADQFLIVWVGVYLVFFSLASTKLPNYILPIYPPLALLTARAVAKLLAERDAPELRWVPRASVSLAVIGLAMVIALPLVARKFLPGDELIGLVGLAPLVGGIVCFVLWRRAQIRELFATFQLSALALAVIVVGFAVPRIDRHQHTAEIMQLVRKVGGDHAQVASFGYFRPSWVFYAGHEVQELSQVDDALAFLNRSPHAILLTSDKDLKKLAGRLPGDVGLLGERAQFLKPGSMLVLGRGASATSLSSRPAASRQ